MTGFTTRFVDSVVSWGAKLAYGPTTSVGGVEVLPVALVVVGFGAGELDRPASEPSVEGGEHSAEGGGGSALSVPIGVYVGESGSARFVPNSLSQALVAATVVGAVGIAVSSMVLSVGAALFGRLRGAR